EHGLRVLREVLTAEPEGRRTSIRTALEYLQRVVAKRAVIFLISDFQDQGYEKTLRVLARKHDMVGIAVSDPREQQLPPVGLVSVRDPETGDTGLIDTSSASVRSAYSRAESVRRDLLVDSFRRIGMDLLNLSTDEDYEKPLARFFRERARRAMRSGG
ncbi:MAG: DUF58 domain-containing protein, partial [Acidobacteriota bacterium]|nr:DUF58 domain-containing protein [Acidobacteriota bacterium]